MHNYSGLYLTRGPPGTGKTTWLARQVKAIVDAGKTAAVCSLTRTAAHEAAGRDMPIPREMIGTLHSFAYRALDRPEIAELHIKEWNADHPARAIELPKLPDADDPKETGTTAVDDDFQAYQMARAQCKDRQNWLPHIRGFAHAWEAWKDDNDLMDFTDLIEKARAFSTVMPGAPDVLLADEAQDYSALEFALVDHWRGQLQASMLAADPDQCLYEWRGAAPDTFFKYDVPPDRRKVLHQSYRVPRAVHALAMHWISTNLHGYVPLEYRPRDAEGEVEPLEMAISKGPAIVKCIERDLNAGHTVMIAASCAYMLVPILAALRDAGLPFANPRRPTQGAWNPLGQRRGVSMSQRILDYLRLDEGVRRWNYDELDHWVRVLHAAGTLKRGAKKAITEMGKTAPLVTVDMAKMAQWFEPGPLRQMIDLFFGRPAVPFSELLDWWYDRLLERHQKVAAYPRRVIMKRGVKTLETRPRCYVGTIHSFKGFEADVVYLAPDLSPAGMLGWHSKRVHNSAVRLFYVGMTRAREALRLFKPAAIMSAVEWPKGN